jgi:hypothetical protein
MSNPLTDLFNNIKEQKAAATASGLILVGTPTNLQHVCVDASNGAVEPEPEPEAVREYVSPEVIIHSVPKGHPNENMALVDYETNVINAYFDEFSVDIEFNEAFYEAYIWPPSVTSTSVERLFNYSIGVHLIPTCISYAPSSKSVEESSIPHPDYPYFNTVTTPVCLNEERALIKAWNRTIHDVCPHRVQNSCSAYVGYQWVETHVSYAAETTYRLQKSYLGDRKLNFRIVSETGENISIIFSQAMTAAEDYDEIFSQFMNYVGDTPVVETGQDLVEHLTEQPVNFLSKLISVGD